MDFHTLSRKQLQALCKKNKIPANMTNVAMANSLAALEQVEGIEEVMNPVDCDAQKFPDEKGVGTPACRTATRRKPVTEEPESTKISTRLRRGTRARNDEEIDQENKDLNVPVTPAVPTTRRRAPAASNRRKKEDENPTDHVPKTPAASSSRVKATSAYNTRKSVRLLEKNLSKMKLEDKEETGSVNGAEISEELISVSQQMEESEDTENGASSQAVSTEVIDKTDESEFTSSDNNLSKISFVDADETEPVKVYEISEEVTGLPQKIEESEDAVDGASSQTIPTEVIEKGDKLELTSSKKSTGFECQSIDSKSEMASDTGASLLAEPQESLMKINKSGSPLKDMTNSSESDVELIKSVTEEVNDANNELGTGIICPIENACDSSDPENGIISPCTENDAFSGDKQKSHEHSNMGNDVQNSVLMLSSLAEKEAVVEMEDDSAEIHVSKVDHEVDASMIVEHKNEASEHSIVGTDTQNSGGMFYSENKKEAPEIACEIRDPEEMSSAKDKTTEIARDVQEEMISADNKAIETDYDNQNSEEMFPPENKAAETSCEIQEEMISAENKAIESAYDNQNSEEMFSAENKAAETSCKIQEEMISAENKAIEIAYDNQNPEDMFSAENKAAETSCDVQNSDEICSAEEKEVEDDTSSLVHGEMEYGTSLDIEESKGYVEEDAVMEVCNEPSSEGNTNVQSVAYSQSPMVINEAKEEPEIADVQSSLVRNEAEAESDTIDVQIGNEDCKEDTDVPTVTSAPISSEQKATDVLIQFASQDQSELKNNAAVEVRSARKTCNEEGDMQKENQINDDLTSKSMRQLKKMLKNLSLENKTNNDKSNSVKEVERKRTALQELPENRMTASKGHPLLP
ncbi:uncharacterized protein LOC114760601 isoform X2 [Neltuma alba]|uniref:uncharacterized protein LOC114760601 isoform X2 n=1 Tax=Neltuma alba TaxID=207710 RepID=UPI0010A47BC2|nr:uncharacterized protein LOC114760601 isoform X2 [Prosopis alba]